MKWLLLGFLFVAAASAVPVQPDVRYIYYPNNYNYDPAYFRYGIPTPDIPISQMGVAPPLSPVPIVRLMDDQALPGISPKEEAPMMSQSEDIEKPQEAPALPELSAAAAPEEAAPAPEEESFPEDGKPEGQFVIPGINVVLRPPHIPALPSLSSLASYWPWNSISNYFPIKFPFLSPQAARVQMYGV